MNDVLIAGLLIISLFAILCSGVWIGLTLSGVAWIGMQLFIGGSAGDAMAITIWGGASSWTLTALPLFILMGEILSRSRLSQDMFYGLSCILDRLPGGLLHVNVLGSTIFAAISGSSTATCTTIGKMTLPELKKRGYPDDVVIGTLAGSGTLGILIPPSIIMIVYGVAADVSIAKLFMAGVFPGLMLAVLFSLYIVGWTLLHPGRIPREATSMTWIKRLTELSRIVPVLLLIVGVLGSIYFGIVTATEAASFGVVGALILSAIQGTLNFQTLLDSLMGTTRLYCMIAFILAGAAFLTLSMGYIGLPRHFAEWIGSFGFTKLELILALMLFYIVLGCFLEGVSMIVLTMGVILPIVTGAGIDLIWFGIFLVLIVEMAQITPPVGFNLFVLQGMTKKPMGEIALAAFPMFLCMIIAVLLIFYFPSLVTWLPSQMRL